MKDLGKAIRRIRRRLGKTQDQFGSELGCSRNTVTRWEMGLVTPSPLVLMRLYALALPNEKDALESELKRQNGPGFLGTGSAAKMVEALLPRIPMFEQSDALIRSLPSDKRTPEFVALIWAFSKVFHDCGRIDESVWEIMNLWADHWNDKGAAKHFRDAASFLRVQLAQRQNQDKGD